MIVDRVLEGGYRKGAMSTLAVWQPCILLRPWVRHQSSSQWFFFALTRSEKPGQGQDVFPLARGIGHFVHRHLDNSQPQPLFGNTVQTTRIKIQWRSRLGLEVLRIHGPSRVADLKDQVV